MDTTPPTVALPSEARDKANSRPAPAAACWAASTEQPASSVMLLSSASTRRTAVMRSRLSTTSRPEASGVEPPTSPVLPPCGTTATLCAVHSATTRDTSRVVAGRTTARATPGKLRRQSAV
ncbi:hypothetical protein D3C78_1339170 [compost metagenome]